MKTFMEFVDDLDAIKVGDKVAYSTAFLKSTGEHTGPIPFARGVVTDLKKYGKDFEIATVKWDTPEAPEQVNTKSLVKVDRMHLEPQ
jgi:hypothetical protein